MMTKFVLAVAAGMLVLPSLGFADSANWDAEKAAQVDQNRNTNSGLGNGGDPWPRGDRGQHRRSAAGAGADRHRRDRPAGAGHVVWQIKQPVVIGDLFTRLNIAHGDLKTVAGAKGVALAAVVNVAGNIPAEDAGAVFFDGAVFV